MGEFMRRIEYSVARFWRDRRGIAVVDVIIALATIAILYAAAMSLFIGRVWLP